jgi:hypothetical protein
VRIATIFLPLILAGCAETLWVDGKADRFVGAEQSRARRAIEGSSGAFLAVSSRESLSRRWSVLTFFADGTRDAPRWRVRRASGDYRSATIDWAASESCPGLADALGKLEALEGPLIDAPGVGWEHGDRIVITADDTSYWLLARDFQDVNISKWRRLEIDAHSDSTVGNWIDGTAVALEPCWTETAPD